MSAAGPGGIDTAEAASSAAKRSARRLSLLGLSGAVISAIILPYVVSPYHVFQLTLIVVYSIALLGLNILTGYNGQISFGHGVFYAIGAYTTAIILSRDLAPYWTAIPVAGITCLIAGALFGLPALRLEGPYLGLATFALAVAAPQIMKWHVLEGLTGGVQGISIVMPDPPGWVPWSADQWLYYQCLAVMIVLFLLAWNLLRSRSGLALVAIRDHSLAASTMGINTAVYKTSAFGLSAMYTGIAGALGAMAAQFVAPDSFSLLFSISFLVGSVVGGVASISGAIFGAIFIELVPNIADEVSKAAPAAIYGVVLLMFMFVAPRGIVSLLRAVWVRLEANPVSGGVKGKEERT